MTRTETDTTPAAKSVLRAIGRSVAHGVCTIKFYYQFTPESGEMGMDIRMPTWEIPARDWGHMQATVAAFNGDDI